MPTHGIGVRDPHFSEMEWFGEHPDIPGMATEDNMVIINPFMSMDEKKKQAIIQNETARAFMKKFNFRPNFHIHPEQMKYFSTINKGKAYGSEQDIRETIVGRILSGDPSVTNVTPEQQIFVEILKSMLER